MTHYIGVVASLAIRRSPASTLPANLLPIPERTSTRHTSAITGITAIDDHLEATSLHRFQANIRSRGRPCIRPEGESVDQGSS